MGLAGTAPICNLPGLRCAGNGAEAMTDTCPKCGGAFDELTRASGPEGPASPGALTLCAYCGALFQFGPAMEYLPLDEPPADMDPDMLEKIRCAQSFIRGQRDGKQIRDMEDSDAAAGYRKTIAMTTMVVRRYLEDFPGEPPRFVFGPEGVAVFAHVSSMARVICKNKGAKFIVMALMEMSREFNVAEPTYMMLLGALLHAGVPVERVSLADLGLVEPDRGPPS